jgi:hypothetical protein
MAENKKIVNIPPNIAPSPQQDQTGVILNAIQQLLNRMSVVEIQTIKANANIDVLNKTIELLEKEIAFINKTNK